MSRVGKRPITLPTGVTASLQGQVLTVKGPKGSLSRAVHSKVDVAIDGQSIVLKRQDETNTTRGLHGLMRALITNMLHQNGTAAVEGVMNVGGNATGITEGGVQFPVW